MPLERASITEIAKLREKVMRREIERKREGKKKPRYPEMQKLMPHLESLLLSTAILKMDREGFPEEVQEALKVSGNVPSQINEIHTPLKILLDHAINGEYEEMEQWLKKGHIRGYFKEKGINPKKLIAELKELTGHA